MCEHIQDDTVYVHHSKLVFHSHHCCFPVALVPVPRMYEDIPNDGLFLTPNSEPAKNILHWKGIQESILDLCATVPIHFVIADGIVALEGNGPLNGTPRPTGIVLADDPVAADAPSIPGTRSAKSSLIFPIGNPPVSIIGFRRSNQTADSPREPTMQQVARMVCFTWTFRLCRRLTIPISGAKTQLTDLSVCMRGQQRPLMEIAYVQPTFFQVSESCCGGNPQPRSRVRSRKRNSGDSRSRSKCHAGNRMFADGS